MSNRVTNISFSALLIVALSLALNLHALAADSFWGDEIFTASFAGRPIAEVIAWTANDIHPPLYYLLAGTFTGLTVPLGAADYPTVTSDWLWRFPSVMAGVLAVAVTYRLASESYRLLVAGCKLQVASCKFKDSEPETRNSELTPALSLRTGASETHTVLAVLRQGNSKLFPIFAALLLCLAPVAIKYGQEARMHALFMLLTALSTWLLFRALAHPQQWTRWLAFSLATTASIYTMYFGFLILAAQFVLVISYWLLVNRPHIPHPTSHSPIPKGHFVFNTQRALRLQSLMGVFHLSRRGERSWGDTPQAPRPTALFESLEIHSTLISPSLLGFTAATLLAFLVYAPWWPVLLNILRNRAAVGAIEGGVGRPLDFVQGVVEALGPMPQTVAWGFLGLFLLGLIFLARHAWPLALFGTVWLTLPVALPIVLGDPRALQFRYAFVLPVYLTIVAYAVIRLGMHIFSQPSARYVSTYLIWLLATISFIATLDIYHQVKPNWRDAAAYLTERVAPADMILIGPLWDEGRFIGYYYRGQAPLLTPAAMVTNIERRVEGLRAGGGRVWAVNRFAPGQTSTSKNVLFEGVVISEPQLAVYEPDLLTEAAINLVAQAIDAAYPWAAHAEAQGVLDPDPRTAQAAALRALGDTLVAAGRPKAALEPYQTAVEIFPGWVSGFIALAEAHEAVGNLSDAAKAYRQAVAFNLNWQGPEANQATALIEAGNWSAALKKYHAIINN